MLSEKSSLGFGLLARDDELKLLTGLFLPLLRGVNSLLLVFTYGFIVVLIITPFFGAAIGDVEVFL